MTRFESTSDEAYLDRNLAMQAWEKRQKTNQEIPEAGFMKRDGTGQLHFVMEAIA